MNTSLPRNRLTELDSLRLIAFGLLILYHVGMFYVSWDYHVKSPRLIPALEGWMLWMNPWRMSLLFVISGAATALMTEGSKATGLIRLRSKRLLLPLLFGMAVIVPPQAYLQVVEKLHYAGSYWDFLGLYFQRYHGFCETNGHCLSLPTWNHLWFLPYLWVYTVIALLLPRRWGDPKAWSQLTRGTRVLWVPLLVFIPLRQHLLELFPSTHNLTHDGYNHPLYFSMFVLGFALFGHRDDKHGAWAAAQRLRWAALIAAVAAQVLFQNWSASYGDGNIPTGELMALRALSASRQWLPIVAALGWGRHLLAHRDGPWLRWLSQAVFPFYIVHQTVIVVAGHYLAPLQWPLALEAATLVGITALACLASAWLAMRVNWLRPWMGLPSAKR